MSGRWRSRLVTPVGRQGDGVELAEDDLTDVWHASRSLAMTAFALTVAAVVGFALPGGPHLDFAAAAVGSYAALLVLSLALLRVRPCIAPGSPGNVQLALVVAAAVSGGAGLVPRHAVRGGGPWHLRPGGRLPPFGGGAPPRPVAVRGAAPDPAQGACRAQGRLGAHLAHGDDAVSGLLNRRPAPPDRHGADIEGAAADLADVRCANGSAAATAVALLCATLAAVPDLAQLDDAAALRLFGCIWLYIALLAAFLVLQRLAPGIAPDASGEARFVLALVGVLTALVGLGAGFWLCASAVAASAPADAFWISVVARRRRLSLLSACRLAMRQARPAGKAAWAHTLRTGGAP